MQYSPIFFKVGKKLIESRENSIRATMMYKTLKQNELNMAMSWGAESIAPRAKSALASFRQSSSRRETPLAHIFSVFHSSWFLFSIQAFSYRQISREIIITMNLMYFLMLASGTQADICKSELRLRRCILCARTLSNNFSPNFKLFSDPDFVQNGGQSAGDG